MAASIDATDKSHDPSTPDNSSTSHESSARGVASSSSDVNYYQNNDNSEDAGGGLIYSHEQSFTGPMPPPQVLAQYDEVIPGFASQIRDDFLANSQHVRECEKIALQANIARDNKNRITAFTLIFLLFALILALALLGHDGVAIAVATSSFIIAITGGFLQRHYSKQAENDKKS